MTEHHDDQSQPAEPASGGPAEPPTEPGAPQPDHGAVPPGPYPAGAATGAGAPYAPGGPYAAPYPFVPQPRTPRVPWVNPARRSRLVAAAVGAAVVLFGAGFGIGWGVSGNGGEHPGWERMMPGYGYEHPFRQNGPFGGPLRGNGPYAPYQQPRSGSQTPAPAPSTSTG
ncbi:MAG: hypothetical protein EPN43_04180 [Jatrophihabitans sp.]|nr:MAG: hypothetical protein EPN43_04180 [Jatrophihabitans sp.]